MFPDPVPLRSSNFKSKKKSYFWAWFFVVFLMLIVSVYAGWHYGIDDKLKITADRRAVESHPIPLTVPRQAEGAIGDLMWRDIVMEDGLQCRLFKAKHGGAGPGFIRLNAVSCDWTTLRR